MSLAQVECGAKLHATVQESGCLASAVREFNFASVLVGIVGADTIVHVTYAPHLCASNLSRSKVVPDALVP